MNTTNFTASDYNGQPLSEPEFICGNLGIPTAVYEYRSSSNQVAFYVRRFQNADTKKFIPLSYGTTDGKNHKWTAYWIPENRPIYNLQALMNRTDDPVLIVEGEKSAIAAQNLFPEMVVITSSGGSSQAAKSDWSPLKGRAIYIWPDNDDPGRKYAETVFLACVDQGAESVLVVDIDPCWPENWDLADSLPENTNYESIKSRLLNTHLWSWTSKAQILPVHSKDECKPLGDKAFTGIFGEIIRVIEPHTESDPAALLFQLIVIFVNFVGRTPYWQVEGTKHYLNLFVLLVGETSSGRKGTSIGRILSLFDEIDPNFRKDRLVAGLSSGEGLISRLKDDDSCEKEIDEKTCLVIEQEFGKVLQVLKREGNTLSAVLRQAWDGDTLAVLTKGNRDRASDTFISIIGHITKSEFNSLLNSGDIHNGLFNRFLFVRTSRSKRLPHGGNLSPDDLRPFIIRLQKAIKSAKSVTKMELTDDGMKFWEEIYAMLGDRPDNQWGAITSRAEPMVRRMACIYALANERASVNTEHLQAALDVFRYSEESAEWSLKEISSSPNTEKLRKAIEYKNIGVNRTEIHNDIFKNNVPKYKIDVALNELLEKKIVIEIGTTKARYFSARFASCKALVDGVGLGSTKYEKDEFDEIPSRKPGSEGGI